MLPRLATAARPHSSTLTSYGALHGVEPTARIIVPTRDGSVEIKFVPTGHLRCSPVAAEILRQTIQVAVKNGSISAATTSLGGV